MAIHDQDFFALQSVLSGPQRIVDVGANDGQSIETLLDLFPSSVIDSFEPNPVFYPHLEEMASRLNGVTIHKCGLGSHSGIFTFYIPTVDGVRYLQETSISLAEFQKPWVAERLSGRGQRIEFEKFRAPVRVGDELKMKPTLVKVDVEGAEASVLRGFESTLRHYKPLIIAENSDWQSVTDYLATLGYSCFMPDPEYKRLVSFSGVRVNSIYLQEGMHANR